ncbi:MAG: hypothetical protein JF593_05585 [Novosphingobium sp.]|nr:hypothetical protein [Novosphingobium sp.]
MILRNTGAKALAFGLACSLLALAGCHGKKASGAAAVGEILPGSASDAMIPLDSLRSRPPVAPPKEAAAAGERPTRKKPGEVTAPDQSASPEAGAAALPSATASAPDVPAEPVG